MKDTIWSAWNGGRKQASARRGKCFVTRRPNRMKACDCNIQKSPLSTVLQKLYVIIAIRVRWFRHLFGDFFVTVLKHDCSVHLAGNIYTCLSSVCAFIFACHNVRLFCVKTGRTHRWIADRGVMFIRFASCHSWLFLNVLVGTYQFWGWNVVHTINI